VFPNSAAKVYCVDKKNAFNRFSKKTKYRSQKNKISPDTATSGVIKGGRPLLLAQSVIYFTFSFPLSTAILPLDRFTFPPST
jgi:hypothetical protein